MLVWLKPALELLKEGFVWATSESGLAEMQKRREGVKLEEAATKALIVWSNSQTDENWKVYQDAKAALVRHSTSP